MSASTTFENLSIDVLERGLPDLSRLKAYTPGEQPRSLISIKLNTNEHPSSPPPGVATLLRKAAADPGLLRLYPDPNAVALRTAIAANCGLTPDNIFVGNGSDEVLSHSFTAFFADREILVPDISYSFYECIASSSRARLQPVRLDNALKLKVVDYAKMGGGVIMPNPNAPTGQLLALDAVAELASLRTDRVVLIDEAYIDFGGASAVVLLERHPNLLVVQTLSKSRALAGIRVGWACAHPRLIARLELVKDCFNSYPLGSLPQALAIAALEDRNWFETHRRSVIATRERLAEDLRPLGFHIVPSAANFLFVRHESIGGAAIQAALREQGILVRRFDLPRIHNHLRISIGTVDQCRTVVDILATVIKELQHHDPQ